MLGAISPVWDGNETCLVLLVEKLVEKALAAADGVYALAQGRVALEAPTSEANMLQRLWQAYFSASPS
jgi:ABC-type branched-subunit amino acid transport system ATPase component